MGSLAQLVEHCTGITGVMGSNLIQVWTFFRPYFHCCLNIVHNCNDHFHFHSIHILICFQWKSSFESWYQFQLFKVSFSILGLRTDGCGLQSRQFQHIWNWLLLSYSPFLSSSSSTSLASTYRLLFSPFLSKVISWENLHLSPLEHWPCL